jgi:hypothetical protein
VYSIQIEDTRAISICKAKQRLGMNMVMLMSIKG